ncbi:MAG: BMC domain-containing protein [Firmicutes bacterium]|nr:BMC domain-containing protein [Bacillota bacterium]
MNQSIGVMEFMSIARGIEATDKMLKAAQTEVLKTSTTCPGKYLTIISGYTESVKSSMKAGAACGGEFVVDTLELHNVHPQVIPAIAQTELPETFSSIGVMEFYSSTSGIMAADRAVKAAAVNLVEIRLGYAVGGKGVVLLTGDLEAVKTAVKAGAQDADLRLQVSVIARPEKSLLQALL